jgi:RND superfamily putative drug exporter
LQSVVDPLDSSARHYAAAAIIICVFLSFVFGLERVFKLFGLSLAGAVFLDAFVIGSLLLPAAVVLLGRGTWQLARRLSRRLPAVQLRPPSEPTPALETSQ